MSFCCGASKVGTITSIQINNITLKNVPVLECPICHSMEPHTKIKENLDFIVESAESDGLQEVNMEYYLDNQDYEDIFESCSTVYKDNQFEVIPSQIDISLDLLSVARLIKDKEWEMTLKKRLSYLSKQRDVTKNK